VVFEVDDAYTALMSAAGAAFVLPETPGKECSHRTCFAISAVVAYELTDAGFTPRTLLTAAQADVSATWTVNGSGDQRVALVFELTKRDGALRRRSDGERGLEVHRYKPGLAEETLTLAARDRGVPPYGRHYARIDLTDAEKRSRPWP
jgi:hypothetical protein